MSRTAAFFALVFLAVALAAAPARAQDWLPGYASEVCGETIDYHSPHPRTRYALLVRSEDARRCVEWKTATVPADRGGKPAVFAALAAIDVNPGDPHAFDILVNGEPWFHIPTPIEDSLDERRFEGPGGAVLVFRPTMVDRHGDLMGYLFLHVPGDRVRAGESLTIRAVGESAGRRTWFMVFKEALTGEPTVFTEPAIRRGAGRDLQTLRAEVVHLGTDPVPAVVSARGERIETQVSLGYNTIRLAVPAVSDPTPIEVEVRVGDAAPRTVRATLEPVPRRTLYLLHHSHTDIGYTHHQSEVERMHWSFFEQAADLGERTADYPEGARFKWNSEVIWAFDSYLRHATPEKRDRVIEAARRGWIGLDALYANELTELCRGEELFRLLEPAREITRRYGIPIESAMITDIPGYTWGLVPVLAQSGVRYFSIGTNTGHRIGHLLETWADKPFWWVSPSGEERVLCWVAGRGYSWFHSGLGFKKVEKRLTEEPIFDYLQELEEADYPYDIVIFRYNIGSDNGPPDPIVADVVREWNETYVSPRIVIATTTEAFREFERRYGDRLPEVRGDFTGHWEDGAASTARETAMSLAAAERLVAAQNLWAVRKPESFPAERFRAAWEEVLLFHEHTWGSWDSISNPDGELSKGQWETKREFATQADRCAWELLEDATGSGVPPAGGPGLLLDIWNPCSWERDDLVVIPVDPGVSRDIAVFDVATDTRLPSQRQSTDELAILVRDVPPLGARRIRIDVGPKDGAGVPPLPPSGPALVKETALTNGLLTVEVDPESGAIRTLVAAGIPGNLVDTSRLAGLNDYLYVAGRDPSDPKRTPAKPTITAIARGPLFAALRVESAAPGCRKLVRGVVLWAGATHVDVVNLLDKEPVYDPEGVHFAFPFRIESGVPRFDLAWGFFRPDVDQIPGSCKNYFTAERWADVSNDSHGVTLVSVGAPLFEVGGITADPIAVGWKTHVEPSSTLLSYVMNNYWETNYKAMQEGEAVFTYAILPHGRFDAAAAERFALERSRPLAYSHADAESPPAEPVFTVSPDDVLVTSILPEEGAKAYLVRLFNASAEPRLAQVRSREGEVLHSMQLPGLGVRTVRLER